MRRYLIKIRNHLTGLRHVLPRLHSIDEKLQVLKLEVEDVISKSEIAEEKREISKKIQAYIPLGNEDSVRILFVVQHPSIWPSWRSLWKACQNDERVIAHVVLCPFIHPLGSARTFDDMRELLFKEGVPFYNTDYYHFESFKPHVVLLQNPYDETRPPFLRMDELEEKGCRVGYIPYGLELGGGAANLKWQFNQPLHNRAWRIFARSKRHQKMFGKYCLAGNGHVVVTGHPKFDSTSDEVQTEYDILLKEKIKKRKVILWTPHFSVGNPPAWSTFDLYKDVIFEYLNQHQDLFLMIRPHPLFFKETQAKGIWTEEGERQFKEMIASSPNMVLDESPDYLASFRHADALMTDVGSFLLEFLPTRKPILYLHHPLGLGMNDDQDLADCLYKAENPEQVREFLAHLIRNEDQKKEVRVAAIEDFLFGLDGKAGERIRDHILSALRKGDFGSPVYSSTNDNQSQSAKYWQTSSNTFLAPEDYYIRREKALEELLGALPRLNSIIDIGCGDGKFTFQLAKKAQRTLAYDLSSKLIESAKQKADLENITNVTFQVSEIDQITPLERYDLVSCMGVTSCLIDDLKMLQTLEKFKALAMPNGYLLTVDTLSTEADRVISDGKGYVAKYRSISDYRNLFIRRGFRLEKEILVTEDLNRKMVNKVFLFSYLSSVSK